MANNIAGIPALPLNNADLTAMPEQKPAAISLKHEKGSEKSFASHLNEASTSREINSSALSSPTASASEARQARELATEKIRIAMEKGDLAGVKQGQQDFESASQQIRIAAEHEFDVAINTSNVETNGDIPAAILKTLATHPDESSVAQQNSHSPLLSSAKGTVAADNRMASVSMSKTHCNDSASPGVVCFGSTQSVLKSGILSPVPDHSDLRANANSPMNTLQNFDQQYVVDIRSTSAPNPVMAQSMPRLTAVTGGGMEAVLPEPFAGPAPVWGQAPAPNAFVSNVPANFASPAQPSIASSIANPITPSVGTVSNLNPQVPQVASNNLIQQPVQQMTNANPIAPSVGTVSNLNSQVPQVASNNLIQQPVQSVSNVNPSSNLISSTPVATNITSGTVNPVASPGNTTSGLSTPTLGSNSGTSSNVVSQGANLIGGGHTLNPGSSPAASSGGAILQAFNSGSVIPTAGGNSLSGTNSGSVTPTPLTIPSINTPAAGSSGAPLSSSGTSSGAATLGLNPSNGVTQIGTTSSGSSSRVIVPAPPALVTHPTSSHPEVSGVTVIKNPPTGKVTPR